MAWEIANTLWGKDVINPAPKCAKPGCGKYADNSGNGKYHKLCSSHHKGKYQMAGWNYKQYRKEYCENIDGRLGFKCTTTIMAPNWQIEVDHIDGDPNNNDVSNLQSLCNCCHRYKTMLHEENLPAHKRKGFISKILEEELENSI
jgi:hypothetical protein